jgi:glutamyl-tRNA reductase
MLDANGANTTAAAAVLAAARHVDLSQSTALVLAATGPVGRRAARLLAVQGAKVRAASRRLDRAQQVARTLRESHPDADIKAVQAASRDEAVAALDGADLVIAAGAAGVTLLPADGLATASSLQVAIDLNAVPPAGIEGIEVTDAAERRGDAICYGAIGVGGTKMKIHKAAIRRLFQSNDQVLDAEQIFALGREID